MTKGNYIDLSGQSFNNWIVINRAENNKWGKIQWLSECQCESKTRRLLTTSQVKGRTRSCGCMTQKLRIESLHKNYINKYILEDDTCIIIANNTNRKFSNDH